MGKSESIWRASMTLVMAALVVLVGLIATSAAQGKIDRNLIRQDRDLGLDEIPSPLEYVPHQLVVKLKENATADISFQRRGIMNVSAALSSRPIYLVSIDPTLDVVSTAAWMAISPSVEYAHPNYILNSAHVIQGSYPFPDQNLTGDYDTQPAGEFLQLGSAHQTSTGAGVVIAVIDGGIDFGHAKLSGKADSGYDFVDNDIDASDLPGGRASGHGTFVAGIIHLVAPGATIRSYRIMDQRGYGDGFTLARAIETAVDDGCAVVNLSVALTERHLAVRDAIDYATARGVIVVAGAGNEGTTRPIYPAAEPNALAVAALDSTLKATSFTSFGSFVDVSAPGFNIYSTYLDPAYAWWSGTSFSAPFVSGLAALLKQTYPADHVLKTRNKILAGAGKIDLQNPELNGSLGAGVINPVTSLALSASADSALFIPDTIRFTVFECAKLAPIPRQRGYLMSTNGTASYTMYFADTGDCEFVWLDDTIPVSNDSVWVYAPPQRLSLGKHYNKVAFDVAGVPNPALLTVEVTVVPCGTTYDTAWCNASEVSLQVPIDRTTPCQWGSMLMSTNAPSPFRGLLLPDKWHFLTLIDSIGFTNDSIRFLVHPDRFSSPGWYFDTVVYQVDGVPAPAVLVVGVNVVDTIPPPEDAWVLPFHQTFHAPKDSTVVQRGEVSVGAYGSAKPFRVTCAAIPRFTALIDTAGTTLATVRFDVVSTPSMAAGLYEDTLMFYFTGAPNGPLQVINTLIIDSSGNGSTDMAWMTPASQTFHAPGGVPMPSYGSFTVEASGASKQFVVSRSQFIHSPIFLHFRDTVGWTSGTITFDIVPHTSQPGSYVDSFMVFVDGVGNSPLFGRVFLTIESGPAVASVDPEILVFTLPQGSPDSLFQRFAVISSNWPAPFYALLQHGYESFTRLPDTSGITPDTLLAVVDAAGRAVGEYYDTVSVYVNGVSQPAYLTVLLTVTPAAPTPIFSLSNYPNPFNPSTIIKFSLPSAGNVTLDIFDVLGRHVKTLVEGWQTVGDHLIPWDGTNSSGSQVSSGIYFYRLTANAQSYSRKMLLLK